MRTHLALLPLLLLAACAQNTAPTANDATYAVGSNTTRESCFLRPTATGGDVYCGTWSNQPSAHVRTEAVPGGNLAGLATTSAWRNELDKRLSCEPPRTSTILGSFPAVTMDCTRRTSGFATLALVANVRDQVYFADGVDNAAPAIEQAIGVLSGQRDKVPFTQANTAAVTTETATAEAITAGDLSRYDDLVRQATTANRAGDAVTAERAWNGILTLQIKAAKKSGRDNPALANTYMSLALQYSNQRRFGEADAAFARAQTLLANSLDTNGAARLKHYRAIHLLNQNKPDEALPLLDDAELLYRQQANVDDDTLASIGASNQMRNLAAFNGAPLRVADTLGGTQSCASDPLRCSALAGIIEVRRNRSWALRLAGRPHDGQLEADRAQRFAVANGLGQPRITSFVLRTDGLAAQAAGEQKIAEDRFASADAAFARALPGSIPVAQNTLRRAGTRLALGDTAGAIALCRDATALLRTLKKGVEAELLQPCLTALASGNPDRAALNEMFATALLTRSGITSRDIQLASARLGQNATDPKGAAAIRRLQDAITSLDSLKSQRADLDTDDNNPATKARADALDKQIDDATAAIADADQDVKARFPNYGQLVDDSVSADDVLAALQPGEAFVTFSMGETGGWAIALRDGAITKAPIPGGAKSVNALVRRFRAGAEEQPGPNQPAFDTQAAQDLYTTVLGGVAPMLAGAKSLIVAPTGALLSVPFGALLTGPATPETFDTAPWLIRQFPIAHVPAAGNFVALRKRTGTAVASQTWIGFGDVLPPSLAQAQKTFGADCGDSARVLADLKVLKGSVTELEESMANTHASRNDLILGRDFTIDAVNTRNTGGPHKLEDYQLVHFATHAVLPTDLTCQSEAALITTASAKANDAGSAFLTASAVRNLKLNAEAVILSACNSGGPAGSDAASGESLTGLARNFLYAGARSVMVTHWSASDNVVALLVPEVLKQVVDGKGVSFAAALQQQQVAFLTNKDYPIALKHPFFWAPFAMIGDNTRITPRTVASR